MVRVIRFAFIWVWRINEVIDDFQCCQRRGRESTTSKSILGELAHRDNEGVQ